MFVRTIIPEKALRRLYERDEVFAVVSEIPHTVIGYKVEQNDFLDLCFCPYSRQFVEFVKNKRSLANPKGSCEEVDYKCFVTNAARVIAFSTRFPSTFSPTKPDTFLRLCQEPR